MMLDFYLIADDQSEPNNREFNLEYIGGIRADLFYRLQTEGVIESWFDYYSDFRWESEIVARIFLKLQQRPKSAALQKEEKEFSTVLQKAIDAKSGVLAFGD
ncbi:hypothetical protein [Hymenobacter cavernae]|uniref:Uncharacterized protein n=1 Tax=Hymenobacter cavernae TaxID=2044852 RepID=A0ABQ1TZ41_9BACT|nr:hypothetical protein [Hymenobacter cavernae]GGF07282.1 hypothetical protein GCM10011383_17950 [Hymenobacter cavernae]